MTIDLNAPVPPTPLLMQTDSAGNLIQSEAVIRQRMAALLPSDLIYVGGDFIDDSLGIYALEEAQVALALRWAIRSTFMQFPECTGLLAILRAAERGVNIQAAIRATYVERFTAPAGTVIPVGTRLTTAGTDVAAALGYVTTVAGTVPGAGTYVDIPIQCTQAGSVGNVGANQITLMLDTVPGVTAVTNPSGPTVAGVDTESIAALKARYFDAVQHPGTSGNGNFFRQAARAVAGVGNARPVRAWNGPGTVKIALLGTDGTPAKIDVVQAVEDSIIDPWRIRIEAESATIGGFGVTNDTTETLASGGHTAKMAYNAGGNGTLVVSNLHALLNGQPGLYMLRPIANIVGSTGTGNLATFEIHNDTLSATAAQHADGSGSATVTLDHTAFPTGSNNFADEIAVDAYDETNTLRKACPSLDFWWNGIDTLSIHATRLTSDTTSALYIDYFLVQSSMSRDDRDAALQNLADRVTVVPAGAVPLTVSLHPVIQSGYVTADVEAAITASITAYLSRIAFDPAVTSASYAQIGAKALIDDTTREPIPGMLGYTSYTLNSGTSDVAIATGSVATLQGGGITYI